MSYVSFENMAIRFEEQQAAFAHEYLDRRFWYLAHLEVELRLARSYDQPSEFDELLRELMYNVGCMLQVRGQ